MTDLVEIVEVADDVTEHSIDDAVVSAIRGELDEDARARSTSDMTVRTCPRG